MTSEKFITENPQIVQGFVNAYEQALQFIHNHPDQAEVVAEKRLPSLPSVVVHAGLTRLVQSGSIPAHAAVNQTSWQSLLQIRVDVGDIHSLPTTNLIDNRFALLASKTK